MKRTMISITLILTIVMSSKAISYSQARMEALFLTDKMAYELGLSPCQYDAAYAINLDYLMSVSNRSQILGSPWSTRNLCLLAVLSATQYKEFKGVASFYHPLEWLKDAFFFTIYRRYADRNRYYCHRPSIYVTYKGGEHNPSYYKSRAWYNPQRANAKIFKDHEKYHKHVAKSYSKAAKHHSKAVKKHHKHHGNGKHK